MTTLHTQRHFQRITWFGSGVSLTSRLLSESSRSLVGGELLPAPATHRDGRGQMPGGREAATPSFLPAPSRALCGAGQRLPASAGTASPSPVARGCAGRDGAAGRDGPSGRAHAWPWGGRSVRRCPGSGCRELAQPGTGHTAARRRTPGMGQENSRHCSAFASSSPSGVFYAPSHATDRSVCHGCFEETLQSSISQANMKSSRTS